MKIKIEPLPLEERHELLIDEWNTLVEGLRDLGVRAYSEDTARWIAEVRGERIAGQHATSAAALLSGLRYLLEIMREG